MTCAASGFARKDGDSWDITESVGAMALQGAAARAAETAQAHPLICDPFAKLLVAGAGPAWARLADGNLDWLGNDEHARRMEFLARDYHAMRTRFFDECCRAATKAGIRQVVIVGAGLDSRAYRLDWPPHTEVYELDQPGVLAYKDATLDGHDVVPRAHRCAVSVDLRQDWEVALIGAGFDRWQPTVWLAEGILPYLRAADRESLLQRITALSCDGSMLAVDEVDLESSLSANGLAAWRERAARLRSRLGIGVDATALVYDDQPVQVSRWLGEHGWDVEAVPSERELARLGRPVPADLKAESVAGTLLMATQRLGG
ncbi:MAG: class I SAM-dependent methyltransferase [Mycobacterium sp.]|uniref:class I SAM-dependent methyltransferase n=1 Tax=Mycobacterium sp. TaxID=1785 RepID=UPI00262D6FD5|nr:class I SAM-dependent methyltransferase [Mycobacterium sp.]MDI3315340.1 class I SAM-dependent methyltransferase [Mycobacterium sp.]